MSGYFSQLDLWQPFFNAKLSPSTKFLRAKDTPRAKKSQYIFDSF